MKKINVLVVENNDYVRNGLVLLIREFLFIHEARGVMNAAEMIKTLQKWTPDVILMDLELPESDSLDSARYVLDKFHNLKLIGLSFYKEEKFIIDMIEIGASGFLLKDCNPDELENALSGINVNKFYLTDSMMRIISWSAKKTTVF